MQIRTCNEIIQLLSAKLQDQEIATLQLEEHGEVLTSVYKKLNNVLAIRSEKPIRPITSISHSSLFTGSHYEPNMLEELKKEIASSDEIEWLVSFIKWSGLRIILDELREFTERGGKLTNYYNFLYGSDRLQGTKELSKLPNTEIRVR